MKQIIAVLLLSLGFYSFGFGFFISTRSTKRAKVEELRPLVYPDEKLPAELRADSIERYRVEWMLLCAFGATIGFAGGIHLLFQDKTKNKKRPIK